MSPKVHSVSEDAGITLVAADPFRCRMWSLHDRAEEHINEQSCREEIASFERYGQMVPVLGRTLNNEPDHDIELIFGARRLYVARLLKIPLRVELRTLSDREAIVSMDLENRQRQDISPHERGLAYARWLREGHFSSQEALATALGISTAKVSKLLKLSRLPAVILNAFGRTTEIREGWGLDLAAALEDPHRRERTLRKAREIARDPVRLPATEVCRQLLAASVAGKRLSKARDELVLSEKGTPLFRIRHARKSVMLLLPSDRVSARNLRNIVELVREVFQSEAPTEVKAPGASAVQMAQTEIGCAEPSGAA
jgi:ParB family chromosome partitioning protein